MIRAKELKTKISSGQIKSEDIVMECFDRIKKTDSKIKAFLRLNEESALERAREIDKKETYGQGLLEGVPIAIKDNIMIKDEIMSSASRHLEHYVAPYDATVIEKLKDAGAIFVGRTNMDEFAMGGSTETSAFQKTTNPWNTEYIPGGSSGGSAAAVSAGMVPLAIGSDTGGSIRQPAGFCGVVGYKPSYGLISRYGACALVSSFDQIGTFTKNVADAALLTSVIAGKDYRDPVCQPNDWVDYAKKFNDLNILKTLTIGIPKQLFEYKVDSEIAKYFIEAVNKLKAENARIIEIDIPSYKYVPSLYKVIMCAEVSANIATFDGVRYGYRSQSTTNLNNQYSKSRGESLGYEVKKRLLFGTYVLESKNYHRCYHQAQKVRTLLINQLLQAYKECDFIFTPSTLQMPVKFGETLSEECGIFLTAANLAGLCGITLPYNFTKNGIPMGVHFMGPRFSDTKLFAVANAFEKIAEFDIDKYPTI